MLAVTPQDIQSLNETQLPELLERLLFLEAQLHGIPYGSIKVPTKAHVGDGGHDGEIDWRQHVIQVNRQATGFLPSAYTVFQCKATAMSKSMGPAACADEIGIEDMSQPGSFRMDGQRRVVLKRKMKSEIKKVFAAGGAYVFFCTEEWGAAELTRREQAIREAIACCEETFAQDPQKIRLYDARKIADWVNRSMASQVFVYQKRGKIRSFKMKTLKKLKGYEEFSSSYVSTSTITNLMFQLRQHLQQARAVARITGLAGLGKTRFVIEACCAEINGSSNPLEQTSVYLDVASSSDEQVVSFISTCIENNLSGIVIVDNCSLTLHKQLVSEVRYENSQCRLVTLNFEPAEVDDPGVLSVELKRVPNEGDTIVRGILQQVYQNTIADPDRERIVQFAQGFPKLAVLMAQRAVADWQDIARLHDVELAKRLLWGRVEPVDHSHQIASEVIQRCALFDLLTITLGHESEHFNFICGTNLTNAVNSALVGFSGRGILQQHEHGQLQLVPKPLALYLAVEWFTNQMHTDIMAFIERIPESLRESFARQFALLDTLPRAQEIVRALCQPQRMLSGLAIISTVAGARILEAAAQINPQVVADHLRDLLITQGQALPTNAPMQALEVLLQTFEKLGFRAATFSQAVTLLWHVYPQLSDAQQTLASNYFVRLFQINASCTEQPPLQRVACLQQLSQVQASVEQQQLLLGAIARALQTVPQPRSPRAEFQGSGKVLKAWDPDSDAAQAQAYREQILKLLMNFAQSSNANLADNAFAIFINVLNAVIQLGLLQSCQAEIFAMCATREATELQKAVVRALKQADQAYDVILDRMLTELEKRHQVEQPPAKRARLADNPHSMHHSLHHHVPSPPSSPQSPTPHQ